MKNIKRQGTLWKSVLYVLAFSLSISIPAPINGQAVDELEVKAAYIFNFSKFVEWPTGNPSLPFVIGIYGDDPFGSIIDDLTKDKTAFGRVLQVRRIKDPADAKQCQIVFVRAAEKAKAVQLLAAVKGYPVLTVGETKEFLQMGGMIYLAMDEDRVNLMISGSAAEQVKLKISAKLMSLSKPYKN